MSEQTGTSLNVSSILREIESEADKNRNTRSGFDRRRLNHRKLKLVTWDVLHLRGYIKHALMQVRRIYQVPLLGYGARWLVSLAKLPARLDRLDKEQEVLEKRLKRQDEDLRQFRQRLTELGQTASNLQGGLDSLVRRGQTGTPAGNASALEGHLDQLYYDFEARFRGDSVAIKAKQQRYVDLIKSTGINYSEFPLLDVGCGRGEWLDLMQESSIRAYGVDLNTRMLEDAREKSLDARHAHGTDHLAGLPAASLGAVTGFHIVEHLPFAEVISLFDQALRVLVPGGLLIFETPNPENIRVGSLDFYADPTHRNPIPPYTLQFLAENRGFHGVEILRSSPVENQHRMRVADCRELTDWLNKERDYAVIAKKPV